MRAAVRPFSLSTSEHGRLAVQARGPARVRRRLFHNLGMAATVNTSDRERVFAMLERPVVPPDNPRQAGEWCPESRLAPLAVVNLNFDLRDSARPGMSDATHRYECVVGGLSDHHVDGDGI